MSDFPEDVSWFVAAMTDPTLAMPISSLIEWLTLVTMVVFTAVFGTWAWVVRSGAREVRSEVREQSELIRHQFDTFRVDMAAERRRLYEEIESVRREIHQNHLVMERRITRAETGLELLLAQVNGNGKPSGGKTSA